MIRSCDNCNTEYKAKQSDLDRGWGLTCSKKCAAEKREKEKDTYDVVKVKQNNMKRELWNNKYRREEIQLRKKYPTLSDEEIWTKMYDLTKDDMFLNKNIIDIFIF